MNAGVLGRSLCRLGGLLVVGLISLPCFGAEPATTEEEKPLRLGPLRVRDQFLLGTGFLGLEPTSAEPLRAGRWQFDLTTTATNTFAASDPVEHALEGRDRRQPLTPAELDQLRADTPGGELFYADGEIFATTLEARRGFGGGIELEAVLPLVSFHGGFLDSAVEGFHSVFGFDQEGRNGIARDGILVYTSGAGSSFLLQDNTGLSLGDLEVAAKFRLDGGRSSTIWAVRAALKLPTGDEDRLGSSGGVDAGLQLLTTRHFKVSTVHAGVGIVYLDPHDTLGTRSQTAYSGTAAWERRLGPRTAFVAQATIAQSPFETLGFPELGKTAFTWTVAARRAVAGGFVLFGGLSENIGSFDNTADVGIHIGISRRLG